MIALSWCVCFKRPVKLLMTDEKQIMDKTFPKGCHPDRGPWYLTLRDPKHLPQE